eukprot:TRINITY_DN461_c1_g1_i1.p1 TRINITY_DN461_c1_g1~~TRINITY_DN461_c1_g1_i1.p1  ORF type:complete len:176 (-),score=41.70 TRINITY_DN461_c1_g1_i1:407-934(-)
MTKPVAVVFCLALCVVLASARTYHSKMQDLIAKNEAELTEIYANGQTKMPAGRGWGLAFPLADDAKINKMFVSVIEGVWQGKIFYTNATSPYLYNMITPLDFQMFKADVFDGVSKYDGKTATILDYHTYNVGIIKQIRDEIRLFYSDDKSDCYIGRVYLADSGAYLLTFALEFDK